jgi:translocation and assembly module TamB
VQAQEFTAMHTQDLQAVITTAVNAVGSLEEMSVTGNITVPRARFRRTGNLGGGPAAVEPHELTVEGVYGSGHEASRGADGIASVPRQPAPLPFLRTNLAVNIPRNAWVQGPGTAVEIRGDLQVTKDFQAPFIVSGSIETVRGFASFYGKKFILQNGRVTFPGTEEINPVLDVTTTHEVSDYVVSIHVEGKAKQPELMLSSQPELEQADIVSLLVFGKTTDRLTSSEHSALSSQTQAIVGSVAARELEKTVGKTLGLDTIELKPGEELGTGNVGVGRYITQDLFLSYERKFDEEGGNKVGVEYSINRKLKLKASSSDYGESSLDLFWQLDY